MQRISSILLALDRREGAAEALAKAGGLAQRFGAALEVVLCDAEHAYALQHQYDRQGTEQVQARLCAEAREFLERLCQARPLPQVSLHIDALCETPLYAAIIRRVRHSRPDLLIRALGRERLEATLSASDWDLVRASPVPLMLMRPTQWQPSPRIAAAVDVSGEEATDLTCDIMRMAGSFAASTEGTLEVMYAAEAGEDAELRKQLLARRVRESGVDAHALHVIADDAVASMTQFAANRRYDLLALGALSHRRDGTALVGTLTGRLLDALRCDVLLVKPAGYRTAVR